MASLTPYQPRSVLRNLASDINQLLRDSGRLVPFDFTADSGSFPLVDIKEEANKYLVTADMPGVDPKDIKIRIEDNTLILEGEKKSEIEEKGENYTRLERSYGTFYRSFILPNIQEAGIKAKAKNGTLRIEISKADKGKTSRTVEIETEAS